MVDYDAFLSRAGASMQGSAIRRVTGELITPSDTVSFAAGYPDPESFAWAELRAIAEAVLDGTDPDVLQYGPTRGCAPLVEAVLEMMAGRGIHARPEEVLVTTGSQQGLDLLARVLCDPGDVVMVELPVFTGAIAAFRDSGVELAGVRLEADGVDLEDVERVLDRARRAGRRVGGLYVVPNFQNPTGRLTSRAKRRALLDLATRRDLLILEDDPYGDLYFDDGDAVATRPIKADDREGRVIYLSSVSKTLAPGLRTAWVVAPPPLAAKLDVAKQGADLCSSSLDQRITSEAWRRGTIARGLPSLRARYRQKRDVMSQALRAELGDAVTFVEPRGGFFTWVVLPEGLDAARLLPVAAREGVLFVPGAPFFVDGSGHHTLRLSFSLPPADAIGEGVRRLARVVREALAAMD